MAQFQYSAFDQTGRRVAGVLAGSTEQAVLAELESRRLTPVSVEPARERIRLRRGVGPRRLGTAYAQLADLLNAGVPLLRALRLLGRRRTNPRLGEVFRDLADQVAEGEELAKAMSGHPDVFGRVQVAMVRAGEKGGFLEQVLERLGQFVLAQADMRGKVIGNLIYPGVLVCMGMLVLLVVFGFFVPMFEPLLERVEGGMPLVSRMVFAVSGAVTSYGPITLVVLVLAVLGVRRASRREDVRRWMTGVRTRMPIVGPLTRAIAVARFCRMLGTLLGNGVPMIEAMQIARDAAGNVLLEEAIEKATEAVRAGESLAPPLEQSGLFSDEVLEMISVGESANNLDEVLVTIAETVERRVDRLLTGVVRLIEPLLLMVIAGVVVFVAIGLILPMTRISPSM